MARPRKEKPETEIAERPVMGVSALSKKESIDMMLDIVKSDYPEFSDDLVVVLGERAINYLYARFNGMVHHQALELYNVSPVEVELWSKKQEFTSILGVLKSAEASMAESKLWRNVIDGDGTGLNSFFALKARKSEYKENSQPVTQSVTNLKITIDGQDFNTSASFKVDANEGKGD